MTQEKYLIRHSSTAYRIIDGVAMIVGGSESKLRTLNKAGTLIWELADGKHSLSEIINQICQDFEVDYTTAASDTDAFVRELESKNMLSIVDSPVALETR